MKRFTVIILGDLMFLVSLFLAFIVKYNHFYEFLLIGQFLILYGLVSRKVLDNKLYLKLYILFIFAGLFADLLLGLTITNLWYYTYNSFVEYVFLYVLIYPLGGIVMVQSYLFIKGKLAKNIKKKKYDPRPIKIIGLFFLIISLLVLSFNFLAQLFSLSLTLAVFFYFNYKAEKLGNSSYIGDLLNNFKLFIFITLLSAYGNAFIHEFPNTFAQQWVYTNWLFGNITLFKIPIITFFIGWIFLVVIPVSLYYHLIGLKTKNISMRS